MNENPAPAPTLTDEQIDAHLALIREMFLRGAEPHDDADRAEGSAIFDRTVATVIARAKREAAEEIAASVAARLTGDKHGCLRHGVDCPACRALDRAIDYVKEATDETR